MKENEDSKQHLCQQKKFVERIWFDKTRTNCVELESRSSGRQRTFAWIIFNIHHECFPSSIFDSVSARLHRTIRMWSASGWTTRKMLTRPYWWIVFWRSEEMSCLELSMDLASFHVHSCLSLVGFQNSRVTQGNLITFLSVAGEFLLRVSCTKHQKSVKTAPQWRFKSHSQIPLQPQKFHSEAEEKLASDNGEGTMKFRNEIVQKVPFVAGDTKLKFN